MVKQLTLQQAVSVEGIGVHKGLKVNMTLRPAPVDTGIVFRRLDKECPIDIPALSAFVGDTTLSTSLEREGVRVSTVEHLLSALAGLGIDNVYVDIWGEEIPIVDGSAMPFVVLIRSARIVQQNALKKFIRVKKPVEVSMETTHGRPATARLEPFPGFKVSFTIDFNHPVFRGKEQTATVNFAIDPYNAIARARTFGFLEDYEKLRQKQFALGASLDNTVVLDAFKVMNPDGFRYEDEPVRHKMLDAIGDLRIVGHNLIGAFYGYKSGHTLNNLLVKALLADQEAWEVVSFQEGNQLPVSFAWSLGLCPAPA